jgi:RNA polymerase sigma-70 factor (ECF subfamily)
MGDEPHDHEHCLEMFEKLSEYIDGELDNLSCAAIERHIENCVACFSCVETLKQTVALCKQLKSKPVPDVFSRKLQSLIKNMPKAPPSKPQ